jgi:2-keto-4-pentenoate hydratase/2-oxohepta-3-ene-1,7-dioic acid hydratase in catechol pathway
VVPLASVQLVAPVTPSKIVAIAKNYREHAKEMNSEVPAEPLFFLKPSTAVIGPGDAIRCPPDSELVHHEGELGVVLATRLTRATPDEARRAVLGWTCVNDVTARDIQRRQAHFSRSKGYDTFCPVGPWIVCGLDPADLRVQVRVNGAMRQDGRTSQMAFDPFTLLSFVSHVMTLLPGDLVATGTPAGVGPLVAGDVVEVEVEGVGVLRNPVIGP